MKNRNLLIVFTLSLLAGFIGFILLFPAIRTRTILSAVTRGELGTHKWYHLPRLDGRERKVQRVSPDFLYSYCLFDLSKGKLVVSVGNWGHYQSLAVYDMDSVHHLSFPDPEGKPIAFTLKTAGQEGEGTTIPIERGFVMRRRLFPEENDFPSTDVCELVREP